MITRSSKCLPLLLAIALPLIAQEVFLFQQGAEGYSGCRDAHILANKPDWNTGAEEGLEATGNGGTVDAKHALIRFDLGALPAATKIDSAWLELFLVKRRAPQNAAKTLAAYRLNRPWTEGNGDDDGGYDGRPAVAGESSWQYAVTPGAPWHHPGAAGVPMDHAATPEDERLFEPSHPAGQWYAWKLTDMTQWWLAHPDSNFGLILREPVVAAHGGILNFASAQFIPDSLRPRLRLRSGATLLQTVAKTLAATHTTDEIIVTWPFRGDANEDGYAEVALARAGDAQWGARQRMTKSAAGYTHAFTGLNHGLYHLRGWIYDPDGVQGQALQTLLNIELTPNASRPGQLHTTLFSDNRLQVTLTFADDSNANNYARLAHKLKQEATWQDDGLMSRSQNRFEHLLAGLTGDAWYDLRVTLHDPDGVAGESLFVSQIYIPPVTGPVRVLSSGRKSFHIQTGLYSAFYDSVQTGAWLWLASSQNQKYVVRNAIATGLPFAVLDPAHIDSIRIASNETRENILVFLYGQRGGLKYQVMLEFFTDHPGLFHWQCQIENGTAINLQNGPVECSFHDRERRVPVSSNVVRFTQQAPFCAGLAYGYDPLAVQGTLFYLQNFTSLNDYFSLQHAAPQECVRLNSTGFGYERPAGNRPLRHEATIIADAFLYLAPGMPASEPAGAARFISQLSDIYSLMGKPAVEQIDWQPIARSLLRDLQDDRCLSSVHGQKFFRSYVGVPRLNNAEAITQLDILVALRRYEQVFGDVTGLDEHLAQNLYHFYNLHLNTMVNDTPNEGVQEGDSWYALHVHLGLGRLARMGDTGARTLFFLSLPKLISFARGVNYEFPVFFRYTDDTAISGHEWDVTGGYIYAMLEAYGLSNDATYLQEAELAAEHLVGRGFEFVYEAHITAATCAALARLYLITGETRYVEMSYMPFANLMAISWLWECDYGYGKEYQTFFGLSPMAGAGVITMMEQHHSWTYLREYRQLAGHVLPSALLKLLDGFITYTPTVMKYSLPPFLPAAALVTGPTLYNSYNVASFHIPLEDLREGWQKSGSLGQQIYGAGGPFVFAAELTTAIAVKSEPVTEFALLQNYPNPFNSSTLIRYHVPGACDQMSRPPRLEIFDILGRKVRSLPVQSQNPGVREIRWDGDNDQDECVSAGVYFLVLEIEGQRSVRKILMLR